MLEAPKRAVKFASNDFWGQTYKGLYGTSTMTQQLSILTGCSAGATEAFVVVPFELVKIRLQDKASTYAGPMDVCRTIVRQNGLLGFYQGLESTFWRHVWWSASDRCSLDVSCLDAYAQMVVTLAVSSRSRASCQSQRCVRTDCSRRPRCSLIAQTKSGERAQTRMDLRSL
jgi:hypothetical protein